MGRTIGWNVRQTMADGRSWTIYRMLPGMTSEYWQAPHSRSEHRIHPVDSYGEDALSPGHYRYGNTFGGEIYYAEFDIVAS